MTETNKSSLYISPFEITIDDSDKKNIKLNILKIVGQEGLVQINYQSNSGLYSDLLTPENFIKQIEEYVQLQLIGKSIEDSGPSISEKYFEKKLNISKEIAEKISEYTVKEDNRLLTRSSDEIFENRKNWHIIQDHKNNILGCFEFKHNQEERNKNQKNFAEMGGVIAFKQNSGIGNELLQTFEVRRKKENIPFGFAVTKDENTAKWFARETGGEIKNQNNFPDWFKRSTHDRYFICWE